MPHLEISCGRTRFWNNKLFRASTLWSLTRSPLCSKKTFFTPFPFSPKTFDDQGCDLAIPGGRYHLNFALGWLENVGFFFSWKQYAGHLGFHRFRAQGSLKSLKAGIYEEFSYTTGSHAKPTVISFQIKPWAAFGLPYLLIELFYNCMPEVRTDGWCMVTWLPNFLRWVDYHISLAMGLRPHAALRAAHEAPLKQTTNWYLTLRWQSSNSDDMGVYIVPVNSFKQGVMKTTWGVTQNTC